MQTSLLTARLKNTLGYKSFKYLSTCIAVKDSDHLERQRERGERSEVCGNVKMMKICFQI